MKTIKYRTDGRLGILSLNRPEVLNTFNRKMLGEMLEVLDRLEGVDVLIVVGKGDKAFSYGADVAEMSRMSAREVEAYSRLGHSLVVKLEELPVVAIAAVDGFCVAGGLEIAMGCDLIYASERAHFALPEIKLGLIPGWGGDYRLSRAVGRRRARELMLFGRMFSAAEACENGLVAEVFPEESLMEECKKRASELLEHSPFAAKQLKRSIQEVERGETFTEKRFAECFITKEAQKRIKKYVQEKGDGNTSVHE
jgi:enoyl-CoA hydratase